MTTRWGRVPLRLRLTIQFAAGMALVLTIVGWFVYVRTGIDLLAANDAGLRSRAEVLVADVRLHGPTLANVGASLIERDEAFVQVANADGAVVQSSSIVGDVQLVDAATLQALVGPRLFDTSVPGIDNITRVLAVPVQTSEGRTYVLVGSSLQDRRDAMLQLLATLAIGGPVALLLISLAGWTLAGAALRPVEQMRRDAADISASDPSLRLSVGAADDEISRLGRTLNSMLDRIHASFARERRFIDHASHELRTPLAILKAELDLARSQPRSKEELDRAVASAAEETDHLVRLAEDLLVLSRAHAGALPIEREPVDLEGLLESAVQHYDPTARLAGVSLRVDAGDVTADLDPVRIRQALDDLLDNAIRFTPPGGCISLKAVRRDGEIRVSVDDPGPGFEPQLVPSAFEPFTRGVGGGRSGLGLAIVQAIADAHGGCATIGSAPGGGGSVTLVLPDPA